MPKKKNSFKPPKSAQNNAKRGLELRRKWKRGGTSVGVQRARNLANGDNVSRETVGKMAAFARHKKNSSASKKHADGGPTAGRIAWLLWGGDTGVSWAAKLMDAKKRS